MGSKEPEEFARDAQSLEREAWNHTFDNPEKYIKKKLKMLKRDMYIEPSWKEIEHLRTLKTQVAIDNAIRSIISRHWEK